MAYNMAAQAGFGDSNLISEASRHERRRVLILPGVIAVICALLTAAASFVILTGLTPIVPDESTTLALIGINAVFIFVLAGLIVREAHRIVTARRRG
jgi:two-component system nitrogen regulation sensor histidine kinase NtrY